jgi:hypothetical protein
VRQRSIWVVLAAAVVLVSAAALPVTSAAGPICGASNAKTLKQEGDVRVYRARRDLRAYGCMRGARRSFPLEDPDIEGYFSESLRDRGPIAIAGRFVAYVADGNGRVGETDEEYEYTSVDRVDLRTGKRRSSSCVSSFEEEEGNACAEHLKVTGLVLRRTGGYAYLQVLHTTDRRVVRIDRRGQAELDLGRDIEQRSLRLDVRTLSWRRAGATKTASLL